MILTIIIVGALASLLIGEIHQDRIVARNLREESELYQKLSIKK